MTLFIVGTPKFVILSICSFGIYPIYWTYQNWKHIRDGAVGLDGTPHAYQSISPFWRTCLAPFFAVRMLQIITRQAARVGVSVLWNPLSLGLTFLLLSFTALLPDPWWLLSIGVCLPLVPVLPTMRAINHAADIPTLSNDGFSTANFITALIGGLLLIVVIRQLFSV